MKKTILLLSLISFNLWATTEADINEALATQNCLAKLKLEVAEYKKIPGYYLKSDDDKRSLESIYKELQGLEEDYFKTLNDWRASYNREVKDLNELGALISSLDGVNPFFVKLRTIAEIEEKLLHLVHLHELINKERRLALNKGTENCLSNEEITSDLIEQLDQFTKRLEEIKTTVSKSQNKRTLLLETSKKAISLELKTKYAQKAQMDLGDLAKKLSSLKLAMSLNDEIDRYYRTLAQEKNSYSTLLNIYLQYEAPLKIMRVAISKGEEFKSRINELALTQDARAALEKSLNQNLAPYTRSLNETLAGGPEKKLEKQKIMAGEYKKVAGRFSANCLPAITDFEKSPSEKTYALIVDTCKKGAK